MIIVLHAPHVSYAYSSKSVWQLWESTCIDSLSPGNWHQNGQWLLTAAEEAVSSAQALVGKHGNTAIFAVGVGRFLDHGLICPHCNARTSVVGAHYLSDVLVNHSSMHPTPNILSPQLFHSVHCSIS